jgi:2-dehydropantoate 2-reductase
MDIVVVGAGSLGSLVGGVLAREHDVTLVGRDPHMRAIEEGGLRISGRIEATVHPEARLEPPAEAELAIVCVKGFDTEAAAASLSGSTVETCLSLQNGVGNESILADRLPATVTVLAGTCTYGALRPEPGEVRCTGIGEVALGARRGGTSAAADRVGTGFERAGLSATVATDMPRRLWEKLAVNAGINPTTALSDVENGTAVGTDLGAIARRAAAETARVAQKEGIDIEETAAERALERVAEATAENASSMRQDVLADRRTEIDSINGHVVDRADAHGIDAPINRTLAGLVRAWERGRGLR